MMKKLCFALLFSFLLQGYLQAQLVINEVSQGPSGSKEYVELVVTGTMTCASPCVDIRNWVIDDNNSWHGAGSGTGIAGGHFRFKNIAQWSCLKPGTIILIYNEADRNALIPADDTTDANNDCVFILPASCSLLESNSTLPSSGGTMTTYAGASYSSANAWSYLGMSNSNDAFHTVAPSRLDSTYHAVAWGTDSLQSSVFFSGSASGKTFQMRNLIDDNPFLLTNWQSLAVAGNESPGAANNTANAAWIGGMSHFCSLPTDTVYRDTTICQGNSIFLGGADRTTTGVYWDTLLSATACDTFIRTNLTVNDTFMTPLYDTICQGQSIIIAGSPRSSSGTYYDYRTSVNGCDSTVVTYLTVNDTFLTAFYDTICQGQSVIIAGSSRSTTGTYYDYRTSVNGCDSTIVTYLTVNDTFLTAFYDTICQGQSVIIAGSARSSSGIYYDYRSSVKGCDSTLVTYLTVNDTFLMVNNIGICSGQTYYAGGTNQSSSGIYYDFYISNRGCDSTVQTNLTVADSIVVNLAGNICQGQSMLVFGTPRNSAGVYRDSTLAYSGCDSITYFTLNVNDTFLTNLYDTICQGQSIVIAGIARTSTGTYFDYQTSVSGCDSTTVTFLTVNDTFYQTNDVLICSGQTYFAGGANQTSSGVYFDYYRSAQGCDSTIRTNLTVNDSIILNRSISICRGQSYFVGGGNQTVSGLYSDIFTSSGDCDSIVRTNLVVNDTFLTTQAVSICNGQSYFTAGANQTNSGNYYNYYSSISGCDSTHLVILTVNDTFVSTQNQVICQGESFFAGGANQGTSGVFVDRYTAANACDSVVITNLTVLDTSSSIQVISLCYGDTFQGINYYDNTLLFAYATNVNGCDSVAYTHIIVNALPPADAGEDIHINAGESTVLNAHGGTKYYWNTGDSSRVITVSPDADFAYIVQVIDDEGCSSYDTVNVIINQSGSIAVPTAFTPNGDGINDRFVIIKSNNVEVDEVLVFNRWGEIVHDGPYNSDFDGWDGKFQFQDQPIGTFVYMIYYRVDGGEQKILQGSLHLLR